jgi:hypothetical protein
MDGKENCKHRAVCKLQSEKMSCGFCENVSCFYFAQIPKMGFLSSLRGSVKQSCPIERQN